ncbi:hypothetical protein HYU18_02810 [Candidatus Woesearchaeota archaeon]|nr:hypothetical protein [Candidatus Woesearchaeota archaeon]
MGLEKVKQEILEKARQEAGSIIEAATSESKAIVRAAEKQANEGEEVAEKEFQKASESMKKREAASADLELQKQMLAAKSELIEQVFIEARKMLGSLPDKKREAHIASLIDLAKREMPVSSLRCSTRDARIVESKAGKLRIIREEGMLGGIIAESSDGRLRVDYSYESLLEQVKVRVLGDVARELFG